MKSSTEVERDIVLEGHALAANFLDAVQNPSERTRSKVFGVFATLERSVHDNIDKQLGAMAAADEALEDFVKTIKALLGEVDTLIADLSKCRTTADIFRLTVKAFAAEPDNQGRRNAVRKVAEQGCALKVTYDQTKLDDALRHLVEMQEQTATVLEELKDSNAREKKLYTFMTIAGSVMALAVLAVGLCSPLAGLTLVVGASCASGCAAAIATGTAWVGSYMKTAASVQKALEASGKRLVETKYDRAHIEVVLAEIFSHMKQAEAQAANSQCSILFGVTAGSTSTSEEIGKMADESVSKAIQYLDCAEATANELRLRALEMIHRFKGTAEGQAKIASLQKQHNQGHRQTQA